VRKRRQCHPILNSGSRIRPCHRYNRHALHWTIGMSARIRTILHPATLCSKAGDVTLPCLGLLVMLSLVHQPLLAAGACVVVKKMGDSLAVEWVAQSGSTVEAAVNEAKRRLRDQGYGRDRYEGLFAQANTELEHAHMIIVRSRYPNARDKPRTSYGCGFSIENPTEAEWAALRDLQSYSWGWVPSKGYEVVERLHY